MAPDADLAAVQDPLSLYEARCAAGLIVPDAAQRDAAERLHRLYVALSAERSVSGGRSWLARLGLGQGTKPRGLYLYGPVGRGKSMLMDLFFATAPVARKRRVHFHAFMLEVHDRIEEARRVRAREPILDVARGIAAEARLLCFDEFQVNDIADAMIIERLFVAMLDAGVVVVATSNRAPDELYLHGLQRERFLPFIAMLEQRLDIVPMDAGRDYRLAGLRGKPVYHTPLDAAAHHALEQAFAGLTADLPVAPASMLVKGRRLNVARASREAAWLTFDELCAQPLAAPDYLAIAERFPAVLVEGIPRLGPQQRDEARRFNILIDALYEAHTLLVCSAEVPPRQIYVEGDGSFEFQRTVSRLTEMQSETWLAAGRRR